MPAFWRDLGLPGLYDVHVHFLPPPIQRAVWGVFDAAGPKIGRPWPIRYRGPVEERVEQLRALGVRRFGALPYAHKPGVATYLNDWAAQFAADGARGPVERHPVPRAGGGHVRARARRGRGRGLQGARAGGGVPARRPRARPGLGGARRRGHPGRGARGLGAGGQRLHRARPAAAGARAPPAAHRRRRAPRCPGVRGVPRAGRAVRAHPPRHDDGVHRLLLGRRRGRALPRRAAAAAGRPRPEGAPRQRLPDHPVPLRPPARGARPAARARAAARRRLAAGRLLGDARAASSSAPDPAVTAFPPRAGTSAEAPRTSRCPTGGSGIEARKLAGVSGGARPRTASAGGRSPPGSARAAARAGRSRGCAAAGRTPTTRCARGPRRRRRSRAGAR